MAAREVKSGPFKRSKFIEAQIRKDKMLMKPPHNLKPEWHLFEGGDPELIQEMLDAGFKVYIY